MSCHIEVAVPNLPIFRGRLQLKGASPMTKIEAFRCAASEMDEATPEEMSAFIEKEFGIVIPPTYIPIFRATLRFQKGGSVSEKSGGSSSLLGVK